MKRADAEKDMPHLIDKWIKVSNNEKTPLKRTSLSLGYAIKTKNDPQFTRQFLFELLRSLNPQQGHKGKCQQGGLQAIESVPHDRKCR